MTAPVLPLSVLAVGVALCLLPWTWPAILKVAKPSRSRPKHVLLDQSFRITMAAARRGHGPLKVDLPNPLAATDLPPISAVFLIEFDLKAGYTVAWKRALPSVALEGVVEYKSLPSGLHTVTDDLIYFIHEQYAGLSAFVNAPAAEEARNARMIAVGVLVPLSYGRLGRSWKHADNLKDMAETLVSNKSKTDILEEYWEEHKARDGTSIDTETSVESPISIRYKPITRQPGRHHNRARSASDGVALITGQQLAPYHPAWSLPELLDTFGPLIFPLHRAALLRKRILISGHAPVHKICDFVYDLSVISNIPLAVSDLVSPSAPPQRLKPLFTIGVHDIPLLEDDLRASKAAPTTPAVEDDESPDEPGCGWIACTTDGILATKDKLYDVLITLPPSYSMDAKHKVWPKVQFSGGEQMKATQRDLRRYKALREGLARQRANGATFGRMRRNTGEESPGDESPRPRSTISVKDECCADIDTDSIVEPISWSALAYSGFMWWASAGERGLVRQDEAETDDLLLAGLDADPQTPRTPRARSQSAGSAVLKLANETARQEMSIIAYFHRFTTLMLTTLSDIIDATDSDDEREEAPLNDSDGEALGPAVYISGEDMTRMGLDVWSSADHHFVEDVLKAYFGRRAHVEGRNVDVCGIKIC